MKRRLLLSLLFLGILGYGGLRYLYYGSLTRSCIYTEEEFAVPNELREGILRLRKTTKLTENKPYYRCLKLLGAIPHTIYNFDYPTGLATEDLHPGEEFKVVKVMAVTKHGITTIDSGPGPIHYLILQNSRGELVSVATVALGINRGEELMDVIYQDKTVAIGSGNFWSENPKEFKFSL